MTLEEIKQAISEGEIVRWSNSAYRVSVDGIGQYHIVCESNNHAIGLTHADGVTLNGKEEEFYIED